LWLITRGAAAPKVAIDNAPNPKKAQKHKRKSSEFKL
jgi:hypothetical protein